MPASDHISLTMKLKTIGSLLLLFCSTLSGIAQEKIIIVDEGLWQTDNGRLTYFADGQIVSNQWFRDINGRKLGDTPNDILQISDNLIAIALNWSNIVQFITPEGKAVAATEDVPNNRKLTTDGRYLYATSFAHEVGINGGYRQFTKGYVAKIDLETFGVVQALEVGYEPEGIAYYNGHLFVANTGSYAFQEDHEYETTISVIDAENLTLKRNVDTWQINLYGKMSQSGKYLCINSPGDYYIMEPATIIFDCEKALAGAADADCFVTLPYSAKANCTDMNGNFYAAGARFSYTSGTDEYNYVVINPKEVIESKGESGVYDSLPGEVKSGLEAIENLYAIYVNPYTGYIYATDSGEYTGSGTLYQWTPQGSYTGKFKTYINPAHFLALPPDGKFDSVETIEANIWEEDGPIYNLQGMPVRNPIPGELYIRAGNKFIIK